MKLFSHVDEVLPYQCPENDFFLSGDIHCEKAILNVQIFAFNRHELKYLRWPFLEDLFNSSPKLWRSEGKKVKRKHGYM